MGELIGSEIDCVSGASAWMLVAAPYGVVVAAAEAAAELTKESDA